MTAGPKGLAFVFVALAACRFGGPSGNPSEYVTYPSDAESSDAQGPGSSGGGGGGSGSGSGGSDDATVRTTDDATGGGISTGDDTSPGDGASFSDDAAGGCSPMVAICNPVHNSGCNPLQQCDVDTTQKTTPTGVCVFNSGSEGSASCTTSIFTESCPPQSTCVNGNCRSLCFCKSDCPAGQCCSDTSGPTGFTLCQPCP
jgi:hypothetical protein